MTESERVMQIGLAAQRWYAADERRLQADGAVRRLKEQERGLPSVWDRCAGPIGHALREAEAVRTEARREEARARRRLRKLCAGEQPEAADAMMRVGPEPMLAIDVEAKELKPAG